MSSSAINSDGALLPRRATVISDDDTRISYQTLGVGPGLIAVGGALSSGVTYLGLGQALAQSLTVHLIDRRGRGESGPQGLDYSIEKECQDLLAVASATGASNVFGHSYGGMVALETAKRANPFERIAVYDPAISVNGSISFKWIPQYRRLLAAGDTRGAFACYVQQLGPTPVRRMPLWYLRIVLRAAIKAERWRRIEPLLQANLVEHEQVSRLEGSVAEYATIAAPVLLLGGGRSPRSGNGALEALHREIADSTLKILKGLDHFAPEESAPADLSDHLRDLFSGPQGRDP